MERRIYVLGLGMVGCHQLTEEVKVALEKSESIFLLHPHDIVVDALRERFGNVRDLSSEYLEGRDRNEIYQRVTDRVLQASENSSDPVALGVYGHPVMGVTPTTLLREQSSYNCEIDIRPGISAIDCLYMELGLDPFESGLQMFCANELLIREHTLNPSIPALVFQISSVESKLYSEKQSTPQRFQRFKEYLMRFYQGSHKISLVRVPTLPLQSTEHLCIELSELDMMADDIEPAHTLYIPPSNDQSIQNTDLDDKLTSKNHLESITEDNP